MVKQRKSTYRIDTAPTGRARCRGRCRAKIPKGAWRFVEGARYKPGRITYRMYCAACANKIPPFKAIIENRST